MRTKDASGWLFLLFAAVVWTGTPARAAEEHTAPGKPQSHCPITGEKLKNHDTYLDYEGQRVYFCCPGCRKEFLKTPQATFEKFEKEGTVPENVQKICPVCGAPVDKDSKWFMYKGRRIFYGCPGCDKTFLDDPEKYLEKLGRPAAEKAPPSGQHQHRGH